MLFPSELLPTNAELVLARYRRLRDMSIAIHNAAMKHLTRAAIIDQARALGIASGSKLMLESEDELDLVFDLAIHAPRNGRSRAIDRYRKAACFPPGSDEARLLAAMCAAEFSLWRVERRHDVAGLVLLDIIRERETWLIDEGLTATLEDGDSIATRVARPGPFAMTLGVAMPVDGPTVEAAFDGLPDGPLKTDVEIASDPRFALEVYRAGLARGAMEMTRFI